MANPYLKAKGSKSKSRTRREVLCSQILAAKSLIMLSSVVIGALRRAPFVEIKKLNLSCGIDFGTSNSSVGFMVEGKPTLARLEGSSVTIPSAIFYPGDASPAEFGRAAISLYTDRENGRLFRSLKSILGSSLINETTAASGRRISFKSILGNFLHHLKNKTEGEIGHEMTKVVMGRPVFFVDDNVAADAEAQNQLSLIASAQGFKEILFQYEPIAAALDYEQKVTKEEIALIVDIGGGTSDFSIVRVSPDRRKKANRKDDILANSGVHVGGTDLDSRLSLKQVMPLFGYQTRQRLRPELDLPNNYFYEMTQWHRIAFLYNQKTMSDLRSMRNIAEEPEKVERLIKAIHDRTGHRIAGDVEGAKICLSEEPYATINLGYIQEDLTIDADRENFEELISKECGKITFSISECLTQAGLSPSEIDTLFFTGGSTSTPAIERACRKHTPNARVVKGDKFASVGMGLAIDAGLRFGESE